MILVMCGIIVLVMSNKIFYVTRWMFEAEYKAGLKPPAQRKTMNRKEQTMMNNNQREECMRLMTDLAPVCAGLTEAEREALCDCGQYRECTKREPIFMQDKPLEVVYLILKGELLVWRSSYTGAQRLFFARRSAGQVIGEVSGSQPGAVFAGGMQAETELVLLGLSHQDYERLIRAGGQFAWNVVHCLSDKIRYAGLRLEELTRHSVQGRVCNEIALLAEQVGKPNEQGEIEIELPRTLGETAEWLNIEPPTLSRELRKLKEEKGIINFEKGEKGAKVITVKNLSRVKSLSHY